MEGTLLLLLSFLTCQTIKSYTFFSGYRRAPFHLMSSPLVDTVTTSFEAIKFTGGGIYFWYQAGCVKYLLSSGRKLKDNVKIVGTSAGSLSATLLTLNCSIDEAAEFAIYQAHREKLFENPLGLAGVWGALVDEWLQKLIGERSDITIQEQSRRLYIATTPVNIFQRGTETEFLTNFTDADDLIRANMASIHIPLFMNKRFFSTYRGSKYIDGSFYPFLRGIAKRRMGKRRLLGNDTVIMAVKEEVKEEDSDDDDDRLLIPASISPKRVYTVDWQRDEAFTARIGNKKRLSFIRLVSPEGLHDMVESGYAFMKNECENNPNSKIHDLFC